MITMWGQREQVEGMYDHTPDYPARHERTVAQAMVSLVKYELGYGGVITNVVIAEDRATIEVKTRVMAKLDTVWFEGDIEEMKPLLSVAYHHLKVMSENREDLVEGTVRVMEKHGLVPGLPLFITTASPMIMGDMATKTAMLGAMGVTTIEEAIQFGKHSIEDLCAAWELAGYTNDGMGSLLT